MQHEVSLKERNCKTAQKSSEDGKIPTHIPLISNNIHIFATEYQILFPYVKVRDVILTLERFAPLPLQDSYDNAGLQIGRTEAEVSGALLCLDVTEAVVREAAARSCNLIISHHPILFRPLKHITGSNTAERAAMLAVKSDINIYASHTNLDNAVGGVNYRMADMLGAKVISFLRKNEDGGSGVIAELPEPLSKEEMLEYISTTFRVECLCHNAFNAKDRLSRIAICGGAGSFLLSDAIRQGCDVFLTGEMGYHEYFGHEDEILIAVAGHYQSEQYTVNLFYDLLRNVYPDMTLYKTETDTNPIKYYTKWQEKKRQNRAK